MKALGDLLVASDLDKDSGLLEPYRNALGQLKTLTPGALASYRLPSDLFPPGAAAGAATKSPPPAVPGGAAKMPALVKDVVQNVVTVEAGASRGSGFVIRGTNYTHERACH